MTIISPFKSNSKCFGALTHLKYDNTQPFGSRLSNIEGVHMTWYGNTTET